MIGIMSDVEFQAIKLLQGVMPPTADTQCCCCRLLSAVIDSRQLCFKFKLLSLPDA